MRGIYFNVEAFNNFLKIAQKPTFKNISIINTSGTFAYFLDLNKEINLIRKNKIIPIMVNSKQSITFDTEDYQIVL